MGHLKYWILEVLDPLSAAHQPFSIAAIGVQLDFEGLLYHDRVKQNQSRFQEFASQFTSRLATFIMLPTSDQTQRRLAYP